MNELYRLWNLQRLQNNRTNKGYWIPALWVGQRCFRCGPWNNSDVRTATTRMYIIHVHYSTSVHTVLYSRTAWLGSGVQSSWLHTSSVSIPSIPLNHHHHHHYSNAMDGASPFPTNCLLACFFSLLVSIRAGVPPPLSTVYTVLYTLLQATIFFSSEAVVINKFAK